MLIRKTEETAAVRLKLAGHLDTASVPMLRDLLLSHASLGVDLDVDLTGAPSVGTGAVACFIEAHAKLRETGNRLTIVASPAAVHLFSLLQADKLFAVNKA